MTIPEAVQLVIQAGSMANGGEIFILDMGEPVKIVDLAKDLIHLSGFEPGIDIEIKFTGLRPGEKLFEELLLAEEGINATKHKKIHVARPVFTDFNQLVDKLAEVNEIIKKCSNDELIEEIKSIVTTYKDKEEVNSSVEKRLASYE